MASKEFELAVQLATGESIELLRSIPLDERRRNLEQKMGHPVRFASWFPFIGRGNVLANLAVDHRQADEFLVEALRNE